MYKIVNCAFFVCDSSFLGNIEVAALSFRSSFSFTDVAYHKATSVKLKTLSLWLETSSHGNQAVLILMATVQLLSICEFMGLNKQERAKMRSCNVAQLLKVFYVFKIQL